MAAPALNRRTCAQEDLLTNGIQACSWSPHVLTSCRKETSLLRPERTRGIDPERAPNRYPVGAERNERQQRGGGRERRRVDRADAEHQRTQVTRGDKSNQEPSRDAGRHEPEAAREDEPQHVAALRAERHADAHLARPL